MSEQEKTTLQLFTNLLAEYIKAKYEQAACFTKVEGNHSTNRQIVKNTATLEGFLEFLDSKLN